MFKFYTFYLQPVASLVYLLAFFIYRRQKRTRETKGLFVYYVLATLMHMIIALAATLKLTSNGNIWMYEIVALLTMLFISHHFFHVLDGKKKKQAVVVLGVIYLLYAVIRQFTLDGQRLFDSIGYSLLSASIATYVFMYFHQLLKNVTEVSILKDFNFWLSSSYLLYFVGSFIIFVNYHTLTNQILKTYTQEERQLLMALWGLHNVLLFLGGLSLLTGSLWISYRKKLA